jgi:hypothetical protein
LRYVFDTYNAELDPASHLPALSVRLRLYRDGALQLTQQVKPGEYQLQFEVTDTRRNGRANTAHQWIDFTVAP